MVLKSPKMLSPKLSRSVSAVLCMLCDNIRRVVKLNHKKEAEGEGEWGRFGSK